MKKIVNFGRRLLSGLLPVAAMGLSACGGNGVDETSKVAVALPTPPITINSQGFQLVEDYPSRGTASKMVAGLERAGVTAANRKCAYRILRDSKGEELFSNGSPTFVVVVEIRTLDLELAKAAGFVEASADYLKRHSDLFDCESKGL